MVKCNCGSSPKNCFVKHELLCFTPGHKEAESLFLLDIACRTGITLGYRTKTIRNFSNERNICNVSVFLVLDIYILKSSLTFPGCGAPAPRCGCLTPSWWCSPGLGSLRTQTHSEPSGCAAVSRTPPPVGDRVFTRKAEYGRKKEN